MRRPATTPSAYGTNGPIAPPLLDRLIRLRRRPDRRKDLIARRSLLPACSVTPRQSPAPSQAKPIHLVPGSPPGVNRLSAALPSVCRRHYRCCLRPTRLLIFARLVELGEGADGRRCARAEHDRRLGARLPAARTGRYPSLVYLPGRSRTVWAAFYETPRPRNAGRAHSVCLP